SLLALHSFPTRRSSDLCLRLVSSAAFDSESFTMRSISSRVRPDEAVIVMFCCFPVAVSRADTLRMPLASMSKVTSTWGTPRGARSEEHTSELQSPDHLV